MMVEYTCFTPRTGARWDIAVRLRPKMVQCMVEHAEAGCLNGIGQMVAERFAHLIAQ